ncbi:MAG: L-threonylcarbamoyladenylate synthase [Acidobacteria bacterium]|nr:L-threonylcarbamoyladenylate synthase [Acidobacteriota bacterium]
MVDSQQIAEAARIIRAGGLVSFPTETVYGLGANALDPAAVERIFAAKGRPATSPLIVHVADIAMARSLTREWPAIAQQWAERYWPGPLTLVLPKAAHVPDRVTAGLDTVGLRIPNHPVALALIRAAGVPIAAPSANRFMQLSPSEAQHVPAELADYFLDGGPAQVGIESTVVSLAGSQPVLLRPGVLHLEGLEQAEVPADGSAHAAPGQHARHYSPQTRLILGPAPESGHGYRWRLPADPAECAAELYATLHRLDAMNYDWIAVELPPDTPLWAGIRDRLVRAATPDGAAAGGRPAGESER